MIHKETSKEEIIQAIKIFGLNVDHDKWDSDDGIYTNRYLRINSPHFNVEPLIIYRKDFQMKSLEDIIPYDIEDVYVMLREYLAQIGAYSLQNKLKQLLNI